MEITEHWARIIGENRAALPAGLYVNLRPALLGQDLPMPFHSFDYSNIEKLPTNAPFAEVYDSQGYEAADEHSSSDDECSSPTISSTAMLLDYLRTSPIPVPSDASDISSRSSMSPFASPLPSPVRRFFETFKGRDERGNPISESNSLQSEECIEGGRRGTST